MTIPKRRWRLKEGDGWGTVWAILLVSLLLLAVFYVVNGWVPFVQRMTGCQSAAMLVWALVSAERRYE